MSDQVDPGVVLCLPDDILMDILSWLPAKSAFGCRCVCRKWRDLTYRANFVDLQLRRSGIPSVLLLKHDWKGVDLGNKYRFTLRLLDNWWESSPSPTTVAPVLPSNYVPDYRFEFSQGGLLLTKHHLRSDNQIIILNPVTREEVNVSFPRMLYRVSVFGIFFNSSLDEYCLLCELTFSKLNKGLKPDRKLFTVLNLGFKPCLKEIRVPHCLSGKSSFSPRFLMENSCVNNSSSLFINECFYWSWMVESKQENEDSSHFGVLEFDVKSEKWTVIPCPTCMDVPTKHMVYLFSIDDGFPSLVLMNPSEGLLEVKIWTLNDNAKQLWTSSCHSFSCEIYSTNSWIRAIAVKDEKLVFNCGARIIDARLCVCDLKMGTTSVFKKEKKYATFLSHCVSLASLRNCKSEIVVEEGEICMEEDDKGEIRTI